MKKLEYATIECPTCRRKSLGIEDKFLVIRTQGQVHVLQCNKCRHLFNITLIEDHWN